MLIKCVCGGATYQINTLGCFLFEEEEDGEERIEKKIIKLSQLSVNNKHKVTFT